MSKTTDFRCVPCHPERPLTPDMDPTSVSDSDGGGGRLRPLQAPAESPTSGPRDHGRDPLDQSPIIRQTVLSLDQIRVTGSSNEYTEGPIAAPAPRTPVQQETSEERPHNLRNLQSEQASVQHSSSGEESQSSLRNSVDSSSSGHRDIIRVQPKRVELSSEELKPLNEPVPVQVVPGRTIVNGLYKHWDRCEQCGRCRCAECRRPLVLPSCWMCGHRCVCSPQTAVEYCTCVCCVKGLFYHCSSDDEDTCADKPFSCSQSHRCVRWSAVSLLALLFPCLLCYLPARACVRACQCCYDRANRPGCRCKNSRTLHGEDPRKPT